MPLHVSSIRAHHQKVKLHYTASGIITPIGGRLVHQTAIADSPEYHGLKDLKPRDKCMYEAN